MTRLVVAGFAGANQALTPRMLPDGVGVAASNLMPGRGDMRPWNGSTAVATVPSTPQRKTIYRMGRDVASDSQYWLSWDTTVDCIRHFNAEDTTERTIYTGDGTPKWTNNVIGLASPPYPTSSGIRELGVPAPDTQHVATVNSDPGGAASKLTLSATARRFDFDAANVADPAGQTIDFTATLVELEGTATFSCTLYNSSGGVIGSASLTGTGNTRTLSIADFGAAHYATVTATLDGKTDAMTVIRTRDLSTAVNSYLSNEHITLLADSNGNVTSYSGAATRFYPFIGQTNDDMNWTYSITPGPNVSADLGGGSNKNLLTVTSMADAAETAYVDVTATKTGQPTQTKRLMLVKSRAPSIAAEDVFTVVTFVNSIGEEGPPGPVSDKVTVTPGAILDIGSLPAAPVGSYAITKKRIYATKVGESTTDFFLAKEVPIATASTTIDLGDLSDVLQTSDYDMPPADGHSLVEMWSGMAAMLSGKAVRLCEAYTVYAWPEGYKLPLGDTPVGQAVFDQNLLVLTTGRPYILTGQTPDAMSMSPIELDQACVSKRSIVSFGSAVVWASPDGLYAMSSGGARNLLDGIMTRDDWQALKPDTILGARYEGRYYGFYDAGAGLKGFIVDPRNPQGIIFLDDGYNAAFRDPLTDALYVLPTTSVRKWNASAFPMTATFKSKVFRQQRKTTFTCAQVLADDYDTVTLKVYADGLLRKTRTVTDGKPFRLPQGFRALDWQVEVSAKSPVLAVILGESMADMDD